MRDVPTAVPSIHNGYVEVRHLRYVIAVAEDLHFSRAAQRLHLAAPSLSKQIRQLEERIGYPLFERQTRRVVLTAAGNVFVTEGKEALRHIALAVGVGATVNRAGADVFSVGYSPWVSPSRLTSVKQALTKEFPGIHVTLHSDFTVHQLEQVLNGHLHAAVVVQPGMMPGLEVQLIHRDALIVALPERHPLASTERLSVRDLRDQPIVFFARSAKPALASYLLRIFSSQDLVPNLVHEVLTISEALDLVSNGFGLTFLRAATAAQYHANNVVFRKCSDPALSIDVAVAYRREQTSVILSTFIRLLSAGAPA